VEGQGAAHHDWLQDVAFDLLDHDGYGDHEQRILGAS